MADGLDRFRRLRDQFPIRMVKKSLEAARRGMPYKRFVADVKDYRTSKADLALAVEVIEALDAAIQQIQSSVPPLDTVRALIAVWRERVAMRRDEAFADPTARRAITTCANELEAALSDVPLAPQPAGLPLRETILTHVDRIIVCRNTPPCPYCAMERKFIVEELVAPPAVHGWQPIETAPKDGREILCTWVHVVDGKPWWHGVMHVLSWFPAWHGEGKGAWVLDGDFSKHFEPDDVHQTPPIDYGDPTHWQPLPGPPPQP